MSRRQQCEGTDAQAQMHTTQAQARTSLPSSTNMRQSMASSTTDDPDAVGVARSVSVSNTSARSMAHTLLRSALVSKKQHTRHLQHTLAPRPAASGLLDCKTCSHPHEHAPAVCRATAADETPQGTGHGRRKAHAQVGDGLCGRACLRMRVTLHGTRGTANCITTKPLNSREGPC